MEDVLNTALFAAVLIQIGLISVCVGRVWRGKTMIDRLLAADLIGAFTVGILVLVSIITRQPIYIDVAIVLGALGAIGTIAIAKYIADHQMF